MAIYVSPGNTEQFKNYTATDLEKIVNPNKIIKICNVCKVYKPERSHHCSICQTCVLRMDHHCPWINNCVGHNNQRYFLLVIFYVLIGTSILSGLQLIKMLNPKFNEITFVQQNNMVQGMLDFCRQLTYAFAFVLVFFVSFNWYLAMNGMTQIELWGMNLSEEDSRVVQFSYKFIRFQHSKSYSYPTIKENLNVIFGTDLFWKIFIPSTRQLWHTGVIWHETKKNQNYFKTEKPKLFSLNNSRYCDIEDGFTKLNYSLA